MIRAVIALGVSVVFMPACSERSRTLPPNGGTDAGSFGVDAGAIDVEPLPHASVPGLESPFSILRLCSVGYDGSPFDTDDGCRSATMSETGRFVAFWSNATNVVPGAGGRGLWSTYLEDLVTGQRLLLSLTPDGAPARGSYISSETDTMPAIGIAEHVEGWIDVSWSSSDPTLQGMGANETVSTASYVTKIDVSDASIRFVENRRLDLRPDGSPIAVACYTPMLTQRADLHVLPCFGARLFLLTGDGEPTEFPSPGTNRGIQSAGVSMDGKSACFQGAGTDRDFIYCADTADPTLTGVPMNEERFPETILGNLARTRQFLVARGPPRGDPPRRGLTLFTAARGFVALIPHDEGPVVHITSPVISPGAMLAAYQLISPQAPYGRRAMLRSLDGVEGTPILGEPVDVHHLLALDELPGEVWTGAPSCTDALCLVEVQTRGLVPANTLYWIPSMVRPQRVELVAIRFR